MLAFLLAMVAIFWPELRAFALEFFPVSASVLPQFDIFARVTAAAPDLASWRIESSFGALIQGMEQAVPALAGYGAILVFAALVVAGAIVTFSARSWRLLWVPVLVAIIGALAIGLSGAEQAAVPAASALAGVAGFFLIGGLINRNRDVWRLEKRISRLADHLLRHPPEEMVTASYATGYRGAEQTDHSQPAEAQAESDVDAETDVQTSAEADAANDTGADVVAEEAAHDETDAPDPVETPDEDIAQDAPLKAEGPYSKVDTSAADAGVDPATPDDDRAQPTEADEIMSGAHDEANDALAGRASDGDEPAQSAGAGIDTEENADTEVSASEDGTRLTGEAEGADTEAEPTPEDPRHASRDISLPPPPPMPKAAEALKPDAPLTHAGLPPANEEPTGEDDKA